MVGGEKCLWEREKIQKRLGGFWFFLALGTKRCAKLHSIHLEILHIQLMEPLMENMDGNSRKVHAENIFTLRRRRKNPSKHSRNKILVVHEGKHDKGQDLNTAALIQSRGGL